MRRRVVVIDRDREFAERVCDDLRDHLGKWDASILEDAQTAFAYSDPDTLTVVVCAEPLQERKDAPVCDAARSCDSSGANAYIILLVEREDMQNATGALSHCADDVLRKPISISDLRNRILMGVETLEVRLRHLSVNRDLQEILFEDSLTGLMNRRGGLGALEKALYRAGWGLDSFVVALIDLDQVRRSDERVGRPAGDDVLRAVGRLLRRSLQGGELVARWGGAEFMVIYPGAGGGAAEAVAEGIRLVIGGTPVVSAAGDPVKLTVSVGATAVETGAVPGVKGTIACVEAALEQAKSAGCDCVRVVLPGPDVW